MKDQNPRFFPESPRQQQLSLDWRSYGGTRTSRLLLRLRLCGRLSYPPSFMPVRSGYLDFDSSSRKKRIKALEIRCYRRLLNISYKYHVTNEEVRSRIQHAIGVHDDLITMVKKWKLKWYCYISRSSATAKTILQGTVEGARRRGRQKKR